MLTLSDEILLYHGSYTCVKSISLARCKKGKDFGQGFYVTSSKKQAEKFVPLAVKREAKAGNTNTQHSGFVSIYRLHLSNTLSEYLFQEADRSWLHFVASNRRTTLFSSLHERFSCYDIIGGKIANDRTAQTLQLYITGAYGPPGSDTADQIAIMTLLPNKLENQFCFRTEAAIQALEFIGCEEIHVK